MPRLTGPFACQPFMLPHETMHGVCRDCGNVVRLCSVERCAEEICTCDSARAYDNQLCPTHQDEDDGDDPNIDDSVKFCPECETPNQFGEICGRCEAELEIERRDDGALV